jgi:hypothetical protein
MVTRDLRDELLPEDIVNATSTSRTRPPAAYSQSGERRRQMIDDRLSAVRFQSPSCATSLVLTPPWQSPFKSHRLRCSCNIADMLCRPMVLSLMLVSVYLETFCSVRLDHNRAFDRHLLSLLDLPMHE